jgi:hypothetical protein
MSTVRYFGVQRDAYVQVDLSEGTIQEFTDESYESPLGDPEPATPEELALAAGQIVVDPASPLVTLLALNELLSSLQVISSSVNVGTQEFSSVKSTVDTVLSSFSNLQNQGVEAQTVALNIAAHLVKILINILDNQDQTVRVLSATVIEHETRILSLEGLA